MRPPPPEILDQVRLQQVATATRSAGPIAFDANVIPFRITQTGPVIRYTFYNPPEVLQLRLGEKRLPPRPRAAKQHEKIRHLPARRQNRRHRRHLRRSGPQVSLLAANRKSSATTLSAPAIAGNCACNRPRGPRIYSNVLLWVDKESGAMMRMEGYDWQGR